MIYLKSLKTLENQRILITGGTGSLGNKLTQMILAGTSSAKIIILSRDEFKQYNMKNSFSPEHQKRLRFFLGDVRDAERLNRAFERVSYVVHTAALKQVPAAEYNPFEFVKTNIIGAENVINASLDNNIKNVVALSTDKAANPINLYGATKLCSDKLFVAGNSYSGVKKTRFAVVRYGNVVGSRGSVIPFFLNCYKNGSLPITDERMTRFWITLEQGAALVLNSLIEMQGEEIFVPKISSMKVVDLARIIGPDCKQPIVGIRPGEKLHEVMISIDDARETIEFENYFVIIPPGRKTLHDYYINIGGKDRPSDFYYGSDNNKDWVEEKELIDIISSLDIPIAKKWYEERKLKKC